MGYRSLKKILGEKNLERKCLVLFSAALLVLVGGGFYFVYRAARNLVINVTNSKGQNLVRTVLYDIHWERHETNEEFKPLRALLASELMPERFKRQVLSVDFPDG